MSGRAYVIAAVVAVGVAGCGGDSDDEGKSSEREQVANTAKRYSRAVLQGDGATFCSLLTRQAKARFLVQFAQLGHGIDCPATAQAAFRLAGEEERNRARLAVRRLGPEDVTVSGTRATVVLPSGRRLRFARTANRWLVADTRLSGPAGR